jgi:hypothetical protein
LYRKSKEKVYKTADRELGALQGKNLVFDNSLYGLKPFAVRFHEYLVESVGFLQITKMPQRSIALQNLMPR